MRAAMLLLAALCIGLGIAYGPLYALLPYSATYEPYTAWHLVAQLQLLLFSGLAFFAMLGWLKRTRTITLDTDWLWRGAPARAVARTAAACAAAFATAEARLRAGLRSAGAQARRLHGPQAPLARTWPSGAIGIGVMSLLLALLLSYYLSGG
jgi:multicomponent Na+:H+ antiporter subunit D